MKNLPINLLSYNLNDADELQLQHQLFHLTYLQLYRNLNYFYQVCKYLLIIVKRHQIASLRLHKYIDLLLLSSSLLKCILKLHFQFSKQQYNCYMLVQSVRQMYLTLYVMQVLATIYLQSLLRFRFHVRIGIIFKPPHITDRPLRPTLTQCVTMMKMNE